MPRVHFLNVRNGDCSIIQHASKRTSVIDVNCAFIPAIKMATANFAEQYQRKSWGNRSPTMSGAAVRATIC